MGDGASVGILWKSAGKLARRRDQDGLGVRGAETGPAFEVAHSFPGAEIRVSGFSEGWSYQTPSRG